MERLEADRLKSVLAKVMAVLAIIGAINWGLIGFFNWNLVNAIFGGDTQGQASALSRLIYCIVGLAGLALALTFPWRRMEATTTTTTTTMTGRRTMSGRT
ncbi:MULTISPECIES: DUF378 domain-containing protein [Myxococcus]|uniref:DUF378 domain-containing protein n=1 Tax=Myxococcus llanfairpwllgwyngyllgogerychwyrndrobwllllantysiliogogogochensis TaxID=2590453 RepID=A0A540WJ90_9BACT|nr:MULTISPECIES: DUF378 domain-containing protein [Myxococcus]NTX05083.1 DUF378 domain-containing protein [Myxococcus sp. CA040A]TQF09061.1 DUF378 domain-containing protein [Myxococcus llanfairpwllgwyngyllgogerychwyrndrobwllllantysiliogogogochensis]